MLNMRASGSKSLLFVTAVGLAAVLPVVARAQAPIAPEATAKPILGADNKPLTFAVASVRRNITGTGSCDPEHFYVTPDGFRMSNCPPTDRLDVSPGLAQRCGDCFTVRVSIWGW
jgi:hypothetical protein